MCAMRILTKMLANGDGTYWPSPKSDGFGGFVTLKPIAVKIRWEAKQELFRAADGREIMSVAVVYVDVDMDTYKTSEGWGWLANMALTDVPDNILTDPVANGAFEIKAYANLPTIDQSQYLRTAWL